MSKIKRLDPTSLGSVSIFSGIALQSRLTTHQTAWAQVRPAGRAGDREQEVVEFNSKSACAAEQNQKQES
jgi:hypothetical protein